MKPDKEHKWIASVGKQIREDYKIGHSGDLLCEMARVGDLDNKLEVYVRTDDAGNLPHFHIWDKASKGQEFHTCVQITKPEYFHHDGKEDVLNKSQRKSLVKFLMSKPTKTKKFDTFWEAILTLWNMNNSDMDVDEDQEMPDYVNMMP